MPHPAPRRVHRAGGSALLVDCAGIEDVLALHATLLADPLPGQLEAIPAATTLLVRYRSPLSDVEAERHAQELAGRTGGEASDSTGREVTIPVLYNGEDLEEVARLTERSVEQVIAWHTGTTWTAAFSGFSPGFAYLVPSGAPGTEGAGAEAPSSASPDARRISIPRRSSPRTKVPAGSVALAGEFSAVYPSPSPGGWQLIGITEAPIWDLSLSVPALITPGTSVRFEQVRDSVELQESSAHTPTPQNPREQAAPDAPGSDDPAPDAARPDAGPDAAPSEPAETLRIESPGLSTLVQDAGRQGHTDWGVSPSGWADPAAARAANRLVGNPETAGILENTAGGLSMTALRDTVLAVTGAAAELTVHSSDDQWPVPAYRPFALLQGQRLVVGPTTRGLRLCVAVRGGVVPDPVLGSVATDTLARLGPPALGRKDVVRADAPPRRAVAEAEPPLPLPEPDEVTEIRALRGPRAEWFTDDSIAEASRTVWTVTEQSNRVGVRLELADGGEESPSPLVRTGEAEGRELPSEGIVAGSVQIPPNGRPVIFMADHPVTGGYPVLAVVEPAGLRLLAQSPPGTRVRLVVADAADAAPTD